MSVPARPGWRLEASNSFVPLDADTPERTLAACFERAVARHGERTALKDGPTSLSYERLNRMANRLAHALRQSPTPPDGHVALFFEHGWKMIVGLLGALKAGLPYVALNPSYPAERLRYILSDAHAFCILTCDSLCAAAEALANGIPSLNMDRLPPGLAEASPALSTSSDSHCATIYTSGTTGQPKGVIYTHRCTLHNLKGQTDRLHFCASDRVALTHSYAVAASQRSIWGVEYHFGGNLQSGRRASFP